MSLYAQRVGHRNPVLYRNLERTGYFIGRVPAALTSRSCSGTKDQRASIPGKRGDR